MSGAKGVPKREVGPKDAGEGQRCVVARRDLPGKDGHLSRRPTQNLSGRSAGRNSAELYDRALRFPARSIPCKASNMMN